MTLKPTQAALWLRPPVPPEQRNFFYRGFNAVYGRIERGYAGLIGAHGGACRTDDGHRLVIIGARRSGAWRGCRPASCRSRIKAICWSPCSFRTAPSLERTQKALEQVSTIARRRHGGRSRGHHRRRLGARQQRARSPMPASPMSCSRTGASAPICARCSRRLSQALNADRCAASSCCRRRRSRASAMPAASPCRSSCATAAPISPSCKASPTPIVANAQSQSALQRVSTTVPRRRAADPRRRRPRQGADAACLGRSGVRDARDLFRLDLCRAVQQIRPRVPGLCAGRRAVSGCGRAISKTFRCAISRAT